MRPSGALWNEALSRLPGAASRVEPLGGTANSTWQVDTPNGEFVVRLHDGWVDPDGVDRRREAQLHAAAAGAGLAPAIVAADPQGRFLVTRFAAGVRWTMADLTRAESLARLARQLRVLHDLPVPEVAPWNLGALLTAHAASLAGIAPGSEQEIAPFLARAHDILKQTAAAGRAPCIVHNDVNHTNLVGPAPLLLDFEYAAVADPLSDLACLLAYYPGVQAHLPLLLAESGLGEVPVTQLEQLAWVYTLVSWLWYRRFELAGTLREPDRQAMEALRRRLR